MKNRNDALLHHNTEQAQIREKSGKVQKSTITACNGKRAAFKGWFTAAENRVIAAED